MKLNFSRKGRAAKAQGAPAPATGPKGNKARSPLKQAARGVFSSSLEALEGRLNGRGWLASLTLAERPAEVHADRLRDVLGRDRALSAVRASAPIPAAPAEPAPRAAVPLADERPQVVSHEPIRTRTMARLLAAQGYRQRALAIYDELLTGPSADDSLRAEVDALRSRSS